MAGIVRSVFRFVLGVCGISLGLMSCSGLEQTDADSLTLFVSPTGSDTATGLTEGDPFASLQHAVWQLAPGDNLVVMDGTYRESIGMNVSGEEDQWITISAAPGSRPVVEVQDAHGFQLIGTSYVEVSGLTLDGGQDGPDSEIGVGILVSGEAHHLRFVNNVVHDFNAGGIVAIDGVNHLEIYHNTVYNNAWWNQDQHSGISLVALGNSGGTDNVDGYSNYIIGNKVFDNENRVESRHSKGRQTDGNCIIIDVSQRNGYTGHTLVGSNICVGNGGRGFQSFQSSGVDVVNNTFYLNMETEAVAEIGGDVMAFESTDVRFFNNLVVTRPDVLPATATSSSNVEFGFNVYAGDIEHVESDTDQHHSTTNDLLVDAAASTSAGELTTAGFVPLPHSVLVDSGTSDFSALLVDFFGNERSAGDGPDIGAIELNADPSEDWLWSTPAER
jgi:hypothetical protein